MVLPLALFFGCSFTAATAFYLPGAAPHDYVRNETVDLYVNALTPMLAGEEHSKLVSGIRAFFLLFSLTKSMSEIVDQL